MRRMPAIRSFDRPSVVWSRVVLELRFLVGLMLDLAWSRAEAQNRIYPRRGETAGRDDEDGRGVLVQLGPSCLVLRRYEGTLCQVHA
jgi:hypothetical protein